ncbi:unnamed protein product [Didymodactylos carnosus]|uniref:MULE transposase domain-containing protein n=1 Tax=Didymodactylos carnosus TaxID=1234261 RepID=A0A8S2PMR2_9BILA|nr:unnamed protein product [Didymodactylos carnosus]CAF4063059.1 unnamed protein product [Didymodactylos carnosus]
MWYCDGTFYVCPSIFYQIYSVHGYNNDGIMASYVFCSLPGKSEELYRGMFEKLFNHMIQMNLCVRLRRVTIDFELAVANVFIKHFPYVEVKYCLFHFGQNLFRKFQNLGTYQSASCSIIILTIASCFRLTVGIQNDEQLRTWFRSFAAVALLPLTHMIFGFNYLMQNKPNYPQLTSFLQYFHDTYVAFSSFPPPTYNHFVNFSPPTTSHVEDRYLKWKKRSTSAHPNIYCTIDLLRQEQSLGAFSSVRDHMGAPQPKRRRNQQIAENSLQKLWLRFCEQKLDMVSFLNAAGTRYFKYLEG